MEAVVFVLIVATYMGLRLFAAHQVVARRGEYVWLLLLLPLLAGVITVVAGIQMFTTVPVVGAAMTLFGCVFFALTIVLAVRLSRDVSSTAPTDDLASATSEPIMDYFGAMAGLILIGGLFAIAGLVVWGISRAAL